MKIAVIGAGAMGIATIDYLLRTNSVAQVVVIDSNHENLVNIEQRFSRPINMHKLTLKQIDVFNQDAMYELIKNVDIIAGAIPWRPTEALIKLALLLQKPFVSIARPDYSQIVALKAEIESKNGTIMFGCGLEPGLTEICVRYLSEQFTQLATLHIRCGGVPLNPIPPLFYKAKLDDITMLQEWLGLHSETNKLFELDEYIDGKLYHCDSFTKDNKILYTQISEYSVPVFEFLQGKALGSITLPETSSDFIRLDELNKKVISTLGYQGSGITHLEAFKNKNNEIVFLEIAARAGGAWLPKIYKRHLGIDLFEAHFLLQMNSQFKVAFETKGPYCACIWFPLVEGTIRSLNIPQLRSQHELKFYAQESQRYNRSGSLREKAAEVLLWDYDFDNLYKDFCYLKEFNLIEVC